MTIAIGQSRPPSARASGARSLTRLQRERFVAFAFAAADLLVEATPEGIIQFATGAFQTRLGQPAEAFVGRHVCDLVAPIDQPGLRVVVAAAASHGRVRPIMIRLADRHQTLVTVAALLLPELPARICFTFGTAPATAANADAHQAVMAEGVSPIVQAMAQSLRGTAGEAGDLGLIEVQGWRKARETLTESDFDQLRAGVAEVLTDAAPGTLTSELAEGRFALLTRDSLDLDALVQRLAAVLLDCRAASATSVRGTEVNLRGNLEPMQAARTLRFALTCFAERGTKGAEAAGGQDGLAGIMAHAEARARSLRLALAERRFQMRYQPICSLAEDRKLHHYEALLRPLTTPGNPLTSTQEYVSFAEAVGLAEDLDRAVLSDVIVALKAHPTVQVAVNVSGLSMQSAAFRSYILETVNKAKMASRLIIELTETAEISDMEEATRSMAKLREAGLRLCLDDFGAGAAGFRYLRDFAVDFVKVDGSYVRRAPDSPRERAFVASIVELAAASSAQVVAEMIETEEQATMMQGLGVQFGQGWLLGRPGSLEKPGTTVEAPLDGA